MKRCSSCEKEYTDDERRFCNECGKPLVNVSTEHEYTTRRIVKSESPDSVNPVPFPAPQVHDKTLTSPRMREVNDSSYRSISIQNCLSGEEDVSSNFKDPPAGPWYQIEDRRTGIVGWIHGNNITLLQPAETSSSNGLQVQRTHTTSTPISGKSYVNVDGVRVPSPTFSDTKPAGAFARRRDGSYSFSQHRRGTCSYHGGVAEWFSVALSRSLDHERRSPRGNFGGLLSVARKHAQRDMAQRALRSFTQFCWMRKSRPPMLTLARAPFAVR